MHGSADLHGVQLLDLKMERGFEIRRITLKSAADFAFLLHGFHLLKVEGVMAIILPHGVLFRGGAEEHIRTKLHQHGHFRARNRPSRKPSGVGCHREDSGKRDKRP
jgi:type I restriction-modification system DNA methylase subunit